MAKPWRSDCVKRAILTPQSSPPKSAITSGTQGALMHAPIFSSCFLKTLVYVHTTLAQMVTVAAT